MALPPNLTKVIGALTILIVLYFAKWQYSSPTTFLSSSKLNLDISSNDRSQSTISSPSPEEKVVVIGKTRDQDISWIYSTFPSWNKKPYTLDGLISGTSSTPTSRGGLATAYLTYIIDNYDSLPPTIIFLSGSNTAALLSSLNFTYIAERGYANLRCTHDPGCPADAGLDLKKMMETEVVEDEKKEGQTEVKTRRVKSKLAAVLVENWTWIFGVSEDGKGGIVKMPDELAASKGNLFVVRREIVLTRQREEYVRYREWLMTTCREKEPPAQCAARKTFVDDDLASRVFEYLWQVIFLKTSVDCPDEKTCFCELYGQCS